MVIQLELTKEVVILHTHNSYAYYIHTYSCVYVVCLYVYAYIGGGIDTHIISCLSTAYSSVCLMYVIREEL